MGKLIVIEGLDGSGKSTQLELLPKKLLENGINSKTVSFPDYESDSSALVKMYLNGEFGKKPDDVNAYTASLFYAVDRFASYKTSWGEYYNQDGVIISGRYTTSNAVHQTSKMCESGWQSFIDWLYDLEYNKVGIPKPDKVIFLDMPVEVSQKLLSGRYNGNEAKKDIHESDTEYLAKCRKAAMFTADYSGWTVIPCAKDGEPRSIEDISNDILNETLKVLKG
ncbi:MAG: deoxynucleoside kinase [Acutalibacteraceae bacterium]|nr:deoxynucleoside kinase [Acutalibacteraceae bacterium]